MDLDPETNAALWSQLMPRRSEIKRMIDTSLYSIAIYDPNYFDAFQPERRFERWAAVRVDEGAEVPQGMQKLCVPSGQYAKFIHQGPIHKIQQTFDYIFDQWLPESEFTIDQRPHIAAMDERYNPGKESSEEDLFIPIRQKE